MAEARFIRMDDSLTAAVAETLVSAPGSVERSAGQIFLRAGATWIEYSHPARVRAVEGTEEEAGNPAAPETVGCLVAWDPLNPAKAVVFVAWNQQDRTVLHSYSLLHWDLSELKQISADAPADDDEGAAERLTAGFIAAVPPGFLSEMLIWQDIPSADTDRIDAAILQTQREAAGEHLFLIASLLILETPAARLVASAGEQPGNPGNRWEATLEPPGRRVRMPWHRPGFRSKLFGGQLMWSPAGQPA